MAVAVTGRAEQSGLPSLRLEGRFCRPPGRASSSRPATLGRAPPLVFDSLWAGPGSRSAPSIGPARSSALQPLKTSTCSVSVPLRFPRCPALRRASGAVIFWWWLDNNAIFYPNALAPHPSTGVDPPRGRLIWNLGALDFRYGFTIFFTYMNSYLNSYDMKCSTWIQEHEVLYEFIIWIHVYVEYREIICQNSYLWVHLSIYAFEFMIMNSRVIPSHIMNSCVNSVLVWPTRMFMCVCARA